MSVTGRPDCESCKITWEGYEKFPPCEQCFPGVHEYNAPILELYRTCEDQLIAGAGGVIALNDQAIGYAMDNYFEVEKDHKLKLSIAVRRLSVMVLDHQREKAKQDGKNRNRS